MIAEADIGGVYLAPILVYALVALVIFAVSRWCLARLGILSRVWHPALFELALYLAIVSALVLFV